MRIAILDYSTAQVLVYEVPNDMVNEDSEDIAEYFAEKLGLRTKDWEYMVGECEVHIDNHQSVPLT